MPVKRRRKRSKELCDLHAALDALELPDGPALDRVEAYFRRRRVLCMANGHGENCQCHQCNDQRVLSYAALQIRDSSDT